jgi:hypothetical protein
MREQTKVKELMCEWKRRPPMNTNNHATLEACQRLHDAGIVLEADFYFKDFDGEISFVSRKVRDIWLAEVARGDASPLAVFIPAPSMPEVWRELPEGINGDDLDMWKAGGLTNVTYLGANLNLSRFVARNTNPTDALIDLLIWVKAQKEGYEK